jgi:predicted amidohydrolase
MTVTPDKDENMETAARLVHEAAAGGAKIVCLPEIWNCPYEVKLFAGYAEPADGPAVELMSDLARQNEVFLVGGTIPEISGEKTPDGAAKVYNTSFVFDPSGAPLAKHRKSHLFDIAIEGGLHFRESDFFAVGGQPDGTLFETDFGTVGLAVCFDVRFPEMFRKMTEGGAHLIFLPAAFNMTTGPAHWEILAKSRALDNQVFFAACAPARNTKTRFIAYGHSCVVTPWGEYCAAADSRETVLYATIDKGYMEKVRAELPIGH